MFFKINDWKLYKICQPYCERRGLGGQKYLSSATSKIEELKQIKKANDLNYLIAVDGGINLETSKIVKSAGADVIIVGSFLSKQSITKEILSELS